MIPLQKDMIEVMQKLRAKYTSPFHFPDMDDCPLCAVNNKYHHLLLEEEKKKTCENCPWTLIGWKGAKTCAEHMKNFKHTNPKDLRNGEDPDWNVDSIQRLDSWVRIAMAHKPKSTVTRYIEKHYENAASERSS